MIDVMFFLLATFMLASLSLQNLNSLAVNLPRGQAPPLQAMRPVTLTVTREGELLINQTGVTLDTLPAVPAADARPARNERHRGGGQRRAERDRGAGDAEGPRRRRRALSLRGRTEVGLVAAPRRRDDPWRRLPWVVPLALLLTVSSQMGFLALLQQPANNTPVPRPVDVQVVEVPAEVREPPKPPARKPEPPPRPKPAPARPQPAPKSANRSAAAPPETGPRTAAAGGEANSGAATQGRARGGAAPCARPTTGAGAPEGRLDAFCCAHSGAVADRHVGSDSAVAAEHPKRGCRARSRLRCRLHLRSLARQAGPASGAARWARARSTSRFRRSRKALRHRNIEMVAVARFQVAADGAAQVALIEPTSDPDLNRALLDSLKRWRFFPGMQDGKPVASTVEIRIPISVR